MVVLVSVTASASLPSVDVVRAGRPRLRPARKKIKILSSRNSAPQILLTHDNNYHTTNNFYSNFLSLSNMIFCKKRNEKNILCECATFFEV